MTWEDEQESIGDELSLHDVYDPERDDFEDETDTPDDYEEVQTP